MNLLISIELSGREYAVGRIVGETVEHARFSYDAEYMKSNVGIPVSVSLPFQKEAFSPQQTRNYFEGLLPEGFTRRTVAQWIHAEEGNYLQILSALGKECLGALKITDTDDRNENICDYEKVSIEDIKALAREGASKSAELVTKAHLSLTGASGKVGLYYDNDEKQWYLPKGTAPSTHIVKQSHIRLDAIVANEQLALLTAVKLGIKVPESFIINTGNNADSEILFATKRYDRVFDDACRIVNGIACPRRLHQEDFAQALGISSVSKYEKEGEMHMKSAFELIRNISVNPIEDQLKLWEIIVFDYLLGNTDAHLKNFSLLYEENGKGIRLAPAYDLISTTIYEQSTRDMAFRIAGVHSIDNINRKIFGNAAIEVGLGQKMALKVFDQLADRFETALEQASIILKEQGFHYVDSLKNRILTSGGYKNI